MQKRRSSAIYIRCCYFVVCVDFFVCSLTSYEMSIYTAIFLSYVMILLWRWNLLLLLSLLLVLLLLFGGAHGQSSSNNNNNNVQLISDFWQRAYTTSDLSVLRQKEVAKLIERTIPVKISDLAYFPLCGNGILDTKADYIRLYGPGFESMKIVRNLDAWAFGF